MVRTKKPAPFRPPPSSLRSTLSSTHLPDSPSPQPKLTPSQQSSAGLPPSWEVRHSNSKNLPYYFNTSTKESRWEPPTGTDTEALKSYMATHHSSAPNRAPKEANKIRAAHLLIKHKDSRRPSSWREAEITRSKEEALQILRGHEEKIRGGGVTLGDLAMTESDCSSARKKGDLGFFGHGDMQKEFEEASFTLKPGEVSGIVETASGVHLIERLE
ncbi:protein kinase ssp1 [Trapelia coarctata]|nr:protein kinase ssp1 [Trapelia coarctata]